MADATARIEFSDLHADQFYPCDICWRRGKPKPMCCRRQGKPMRCPHHPDVPELYFVLGDPSLAICDLCLDGAYPQLTLGWFRQKFPKDIADVIESLAYPEWAKLTKKEDEANHPAAKFAIFSETSKHPVDIGQVRARGLLLRKCVLPDTPASEIKECEVLLKMAYRIARLSLPLDDVNVAR